MSYKIAQFEKFCPSMWKSVRSERAIWSYSAPLLKHQVVTQNSPKKLNVSQTFQGILNWILQILHHYCRERHRKNKKLTVYWTKCCYYFLPFSLLTAFCAFRLNQRKSSQVLGLSTLQKYSRFSKWQVISVHAGNNIF